MTEKKSTTGTKVKSSGNLTNTKRKFGNENKVTAQGHSQFSRPMKSKKNWKRGVKKYRGQGR